MREKEADKANSSSFPWWRLTRFVYIFQLGPKFRTYRLLVMERKTGNYNKNDWFLRKSRKHSCALLHKSLYIHVYIIMYMKLGSELKNVNKACDVTRETMNI